MISVILLLDENYDHVLDTIESIKNQTSQDIETIAICNETKNDLLTLLNENVDKLIATKTKKHPAILMNEAAKRAKGEILLFIQPNTVIPETTIEEIEKTKDQWVIGTCLVSNTTIEVKTDFFTKLKTKFLTYKNPKLIFCKKLTFEVLAGFDETKEKNHFKNIINKFKKKGKFLILETPVTEV
jgi:hypothetical protein